MERLKREKRKKYKWKINIIRKVKEYKEGLNNSSVLIFFFFTFSTLLFQPLKRIHPENNELERLTAFNQTNRFTEFIIIFAALY